MESEKSPQISKRKTFSNFLRKAFFIPIDFFARLFMNWGIHPNHLTEFGLIGTVIGAYFVAQGKFTLGGLILLLMGPFDALDGALARMMEEKDPFGPMLDSITDRYIEIFIYGGLIYYYSINENILYVILSFIALSGSMMVSYSRARAESLGVDVKVGIFTRVERFLIIVPSIFFNIPHIGLWILAIGSNFTAMRRMLYTRKHLRNNTNGEK
jgi:CDP-diacylglycerol--glycerol-3-phosphate 3-phosphatidyltransferase